MRNLPSSGARAAFALAALTLACGRDRATSSSTSATATPAPPPAASSSANEPVTIEAKLSLIAQPDGAGAVRVLLSAPELQLGEPIAVVRFPYACVATAAEASQPWRVSCSPRYRKALAEAELSAGKLTLRLLSETPPRSIERAVPSNIKVILSEAVVDARSEPCASAEPKRELRVTFPSANWYAGYKPDSITYLAFPGLAQPLALVNENRWWRGCKAVAADDAVEFRCPDERHFARIQSDGSALRFEWRDTTKHVGRVLLPCSAYATLVAPATFNEGNRYF